MKGKDSYKICIICEGEEEFDYLNTLRQLNVWSNKYSLKLINASSLNNIVSYYQHAYFSTAYDLVLIFCDTEMEPYSHYKELKEKLTRFFGNVKKANNVIFFANPCTMQIVLSHFGEIKLQSNDKTKNQPIIEKLTGVKEYRANEKQRSSIMKKINVENYETLKTNLSKLETNDKIVGASNFLQLINYLESNNTKRIKHIITKLDKD